MSYSSALSRQRRAFPLDRFIFITLRLLKERAALVDADGCWLALIFNRSRLLHPRFFSARVFHPHHWVFALKGHESVAGGNAFGRGAIWSRP